MTPLSEAIATQLLLVVFPGLVMHRFIAMRLLALDAPKSPMGVVGEVELLGFGLLPGLAISNTVGTVLAIFGIFRTVLFVAVMLAVVAWRWRDAQAILLAVGDVFRLSWRSLARGNFMVIVAFAIFLQTIAGLLVMTQLPSLNVDVWNHNFPLAESIVSHHGFIMPQINNMFYGSYPIFFHMFFAEGLLFVNDIAAAKIVNILIYLSFLLSLICFAQRARAVAVVIIGILIIDNPFSSGDAPDAMTDIGRVCFSAMAFALTYQYFRTGRLYFIFAAGLLAGGAIAGKYTELLTPVLIGVSLLPPLVKRRYHSMTAIGIFVAAAIVTGAYPYVRNIILLHNPIYPFLFGHPGLSDDYVRGLQIEVFRSLDPGLRAFSQNLLTLTGWRDFGKAANVVFLSHWDRSFEVIAVILVGYAIRRDALIYLILWTFAAWIFWYTIGSMNMRWGEPAFMMLSLTAYLTAVSLIDFAVSFVTSPSARVRLRRRVPIPEIWVQDVPSWINAADIARVAVSAWAVWICFSFVDRVRANGLVDARPPWLSREMTGAFWEPGGLDAYMKRTREGYEIYRYIGQHDLHTVLQPFDNGAGFYQAAYNGGKDGNWILPWYRLPTKESEFDQFLRDNSIKYFVYVPSLPAVQIERLASGSNDPKHTEMAYALMRYMIPNSHLIMTDPFGWELRELDGAK
jgi:hypothetical protein